MDGMRFIGKKIAAISSKTTKFFKVSPPPSLVNPCRPDRISSWRPQNPCQSDWEKKKNRVVGYFENLDDFLSSLES